MNFIKKLSLGLLIGVALTQCATQKEFDFGRTLARENQTKLAQMSAVDAFFRSVVAVKYGPDDPCARMTLAVMDEMTEANRRIHATSTQIAATVPKGFPLQVEFLKQDPTLMLHRQWCDSVQRFVQFHLAEARQLNALALRNAKRLDASFTRQPALSFAVGLRKGIATNEATEATLRAMNVLVARVREGVAHLEKTRGRWAVMNDKIVFLKEEERSQLLKIAAQVMQASLKVLATAPP